MDREESENGKEDMLIDGQKQGNVSVTSEFNVNYLKLYYGNQTKP
jgi:DNA primase small subunit